MKTLTTGQVFALLRAGFSVANITPETLTLEMKQALAKAGEAK